MISIIIIITIECLGICVFNQGKQKVNSLDVTLTGDKPFEEKGFYVSKCSGNQTHVQNMMSKTNDIGTVLERLGCTLKVAKIHEYLCQNLYQKLCVIRVAYEWFLI